MIDMAIHNIAGYKFISLAELPILQESLLQAGIKLDLKGTILLSNEGININIAGNTEAIHQFKAILQQDHRFADMTFRESFSEAQPFRKMKVKLRNEIITMRQEEIDPEQNRAPSLSPEQFKQWLDEKRDMMVLDTRNDYEVEFGTFDQAISLGLNDFSEFPEKSQHLAKDKPIVMFCTGGIRCEKAAVYLLQQGYENVFQLAGGILNYFAEVGGAHYHGECFVFDGRVALDAELKTTGTQQCTVCQYPMKSSENHQCIK